MNGSLEGNAISNSTDNYQYPISHPAFKPPSKVHPGLYQRNDSQKSEYTFSSSPLLLDKGTTAEMQKRSLIRPLPQGAACILVMWLLQQWIEWIRHINNSANHRAAHQENLFSLALVDLRFHHTQGGSCTCAFMYLHLFIPSSNIGKLYLGKL